MADLHRYVIRQQQIRDITVDALNAQHARTLAEEDASATGDAELIQSQSTVQTASNVGTEGGQPLHRFDVAVRFRRNLLIDGLDKTDARNFAKQDSENLPDARNIQAQTVTFLKEKTGIG